MKAPTPWRLDSDSDGRRVLDAKGQTLMWFPALDLPFWTRIVRAMNAYADPLLPNQVQGLALTLESLLPKIGELQHSLWLHRPVCGAEWYSGGTLSVVQTCTRHPDHADEHACVLNGSAKAQLFTWKAE